MKASVLLFFFSSESRIIRSSCYNRSLKWPKIQYDKDDEDEQQKLTRERREGGQEKEEEEKEVEQQ